MSGRHRAQRPYGPRALIIPHPWRTVFWAGVPATCAAALRCAAARLSGRPRPLPAGGRPPARTCRALRPPRRRWHPATLVVVPLLPALALVARGYGYTPGYGSGSADGAVRVLRVSPGDSGAAAGAGDAGAAGAPSVLRDVRAQAAAPARVGADVLSAVDGSAGDLSDVPGDVAGRTWELAAVAPDGLTPDGLVVGGADRRPADPAPARTTTDPGRAVRTALPDTGTGTGTQAWPIPRPVDTVAAAVDSSAGRPDGIPVVPSSTEGSAAGTAGRSGAPAATATLLPAGARADGATGWGTGADDDATGAGGWSAGSWDRGYPATAPTAGTAPTARGGSWWGVAAGRAGS